MFKVTFRTRKEPKKAEIKPKKVEKNRTFENSSLNRIGPEKPKVALHDRKTLSFCQKSTEGTSIEKKTSKAHSAEKNTKGPFGLPFLCKQKIGLVRDSNPRTPASQTSENPR